VLLEETNGLCGGSSQPFRYLHDKVSVFAGMAIHCVPDKFR